MRILVILVFSLIVQGCGMLGKNDVELAQTAVKLYDQGNYRAAIIEAKNALQENTENLLARETLATIYLEIGDGPSAEKEVNQAIGIGGATETLNFIKLKAMLLQGKFSNAIDIAKQLDQESGISAANLLLINAQASLGMGKTDVAEQDFNQLLTDATHRTAAVNGLIKIAMINNEPTQAIILVDENIAKGIFDNETWQLKGAILLSQKQFQLAAVAFENALDKQDDAKIATTYSSHIGLVRATLSLKDYDKASEQVTRIEKLMPRSPEVKYLRGLLEYRRGNIELAKRSLDQVLQIVPSHKASILLMGSISFSENNLEQANDYLTRYVKANPANAEARKMLGLTRIKLNKPESALSVLEPLLKTQPDDAETLALMGKINVLRGDAEKGITLLEKASQLSPKNQKIELAIVKALLMDGEIDSAIEKLKTLNKSDTSDTTGLMLAMTYAKQGDLKKSVQTLDKIIKANPEKAEYRLMKASVINKLGSAQQAKKIVLDVLENEKNNLSAKFMLAHLEENADNLDLAIKLYDEILQQDQGNLAATTRIARLLAMQGDTARFVSYLEDATEQHPQAIIPKVLLTNHFLRVKDFDKANNLVAALEQIDADDERVLFVSALSAIGNGGFSTALRKLEKYITLNDKNAVAYYQLARLYHRDQQNDKEQTSLEQAIKVNKKHIPSHMALVSLKLNQQAFDQALVLADKLIAIEAGKSVGYMLKGDVWLQQNKIAKALALYQQANAVKSSVGLVERLFDAHNRLDEPKQAKAVATNWLNDHPGEERITTLLASNLLMEENYLEAVAHYEKVHKKHPNNVAILNNLSWSLFKAEDDRAPSVAKKGYDISPNDALMVDTYGWILVNTGELAKGLKLLQRANLLQPKNLEINFHLASALLKSGKNNEAERYLVGMTEQNMTFSEADEARQLIKQLQ